MDHSQPTKSQNTPEIDEKLLETIKKLLPGVEDPTQRDTWEFQKAIIERIRNKQDVLAIMPTGGGKSICYQAPALCPKDDDPGITLVITPLLALMEDQVKTLRNKGFGDEVACLSSGFIVDRDGFHYAKKANTDDETETVAFRKLRNQIFLDAYRGKYKLLYVTPERLRTGSFIRFAQKTGIRMIAVDEAHCISMWGYEFRPRYLEISRLLTRIGYHPTIAAFTATATKSVREDIVRLLAMDDYRLIGDVSKERENLKFSICRIKPAKTEAAETGRKHRILFDDLQRFEGESGFVYCSKVRFVKEVYDYLKRKNVSVTRYYADLDDDPEREKGESKKRNFEDFLSGRKKVMVSTTALGMGIDKENIRFVIHYNLPLCLENYFQEAGRAGRDSRDRCDEKDSECILYYSEGDVAVCKELINSSINGSGLSDQDRDERKRVAEKRLDRMKEYALLDPDTDSQTRSQILQRWILDYFRDFVPYDGKRPGLDVEKDIKKNDILYVNRTKIAGELRKGAHMEGDGLSVGSGKPAPTVSYRVTGGTLTYFDMMVADAVYTLMKNRAPTSTFRPKIYAKTVMGLLSGNDELTLRPDKLEKVEQSIRKMMGMRIYIDRRKSAYCGFAYDDQKKKTEMEGPFLPLIEKERGFEYKKGAIPPLYEYAEILNGQFYSFPPKYLRVEGLPTSVENLSMIHYLLCRIHMMAKPGEVKRSHAVTTPALLFDTLLKDLQILPPAKSIDPPQDPENDQNKEMSVSNRNRKKRDCWNKMIKILDHLQNIGVIQKYEADPYESVRLYRFVLKGKKNKTDKRK